MKYNLKNRPKPLYLVNSPYAGDWLKAYEKWFEGFEAELRQIRDLAKNQIESYENELKNLESSQGKKRGVPKGQKKIEQLRCLIRAWKHSLILANKILGEEADSE